MKQDKGLILVGVISSAHGIKGNVLIRSYMTPKENIFLIKILNTQNAPIKLKKIRETSSESFVCQLDSCDDRNTAESLKGTKLFCQRSDLPNLPEEEYYFCDLKNLDVLNESGNKIGAVINVANFGAGDIIEVKFTDNIEEMISFTKENFPKITKNHIILSDIYLRIK